ncbi:hypothetical protein [Halomonas sp. H5]|uniref:hypothetical protein n=1 Tax=Halomonas sp. H5 TaxID=3423910 RepID=UPI003D367458
MKTTTIPAPAHPDAHLNRAAIRGSFMAMQGLGVSKETNIEVMRDLKDHIRRHDAEPSAWFTGPTRAQWVSARLNAGEEMTNEEIGRALRPD